MIEYPEKPSSFKKIKKIDFQGRPGWRARLRNSVSHASGIEAAVAGPPLALTVIRRPGAPIRELQLVRNEAAGYRIRSGTGCALRCRIGNRALSQHHAEPFFRRKMVFLEIGERAAIVDHQKVTVGVERRQDAVPDIAGEVNALIRARKKGLRPDRAANIVFTDDHQPWPVAQGEKGLGASWMPLNHRHLVGQLVMLAGENADNGGGIGFGKVHRRKGMMALALAIIDGEAVRPFALNHIAEWRKGLTCQGLSWEHWAWIVVHCGRPVARMGREWGKTIALSVADTTDAHRRRPGG